MFKRVSRQGGGKQASRPPPRWGEGRDEITGICLVCITFLRLVDFHAGVGCHVFFLHGENLNVKLIFDGRHHDSTVFQRLEHKPLLR